MKTHIPRPSLLALSFIIICNLSALFSLAVIGPGDLGLLDNTNFYSTTMPNDLFDPNDTVDRKNIYEEPEFTILANKTLIDNENDNLDLNSHNQVYINRFKDDHYIEYYEYLIKYALERQCFPESTSPFTKFKQKVKYALKGFQICWLDQIRPKIDYIIIKANKLIELNLDSIQEHHLNLSTNFPYAYTSTLLGSTLLIVYFAAWLCNRSHTLNYKNEQEMVVQMLQRINWFCESAHALKNSSSKQHISNPEEDISAYMHLIQSNLTEIDLQLQDLGRFTTLLTNFVQSIEKDIQSIHRHFNYDDKKNFQQLFEAGEYKDSVERIGINDNQTTPHIYDLTSYDA